MRTLEHYYQRARRQQFRSDQRSLDIVNVLRQAHSNKKLKPKTVYELYKTDERSKEEKKEQMRKNNQLAKQAFGKSIGE